MILPEIDAYRFGKMVINKEVFTSDLIIFPNGKIKASWYRRAGHLLSFCDLDDLILEKPNLIIAGTGAHGRMAIDPELITKLASMEIEIMALSTDKAVTHFNLYRKQRVYACFDLFC